MIQPSRFMWEAKWMSQADSPRLDSSELLNQRLSSLWSSYPFWLLYRKKSTRLLWQNKKQTNKLNKSQVIGPWHSSYYCGTGSGPSFSIGRSTSLKCNQCSRWPAIGGHCGHFKKWQSKNTRSEICPQSGTMVNGQQPTPHKRYTRGFSNSISISISFLVSRSRSTKSGYANGFFSPAEYHEYHSQCNRAHLQKKYLTKTSFFSPSD